MARLASHTNLTGIASALVISYLAAIVAFVLSLLQPIDNAEQGTVDWRFLFRGPIGDRPTNIALVTVNEEANLPYSTPVPREHVAKVVNSLAAAGTRLIGLDFYLGSKSFDAYGDSLLKDAIINAGNVIPVSYLERNDEGQLKEHKAIPYFLDGALDYGHATFFTDTGVGTVREGKAAIGIQGKHVLSLAGCLFAHIRGLDTDEIRNREWSQRFEGLPASDNDYRHIIDYNGPPYQYYRRLDYELPGGLVAFSSHQVTSLPPSILASALKDRVVIVGSGLTDTADLYRTPFFSIEYDFERTFGAEIHAQFLNTMLSKDPLYRAGFFLSALFILVPAFATAFFSVRLRSYLALPLTLVVILLLWVLGFYLFESLHLVIPFVTPALACSLATLFGLTYMGSTDGRRRNEVRDRFAPMVGEAQLNQILQQPKTWGTEGEERIVSVVWVEPRSLETSRPGSARKTVLLLQEYLQQMSALVFKHGGTVFRYEEDSLAAAFGVPIGQQDHATRAAMCAIDMAEACLGWHDQKADDGWQLSIGADSGLTIVGEVGGDEHYAYRVMGQPVARARELSHEQDGKGEVRITQDLYGQVKGDVSAEAIASATSYSVLRITGRAAALPIGAAEKPDNPFWKYLGLTRREENPVSNELLERLILFSDFSQRDLSYIRRVIHHRAFKAGERVFIQGEVGSAMYVIQSGTVDILQETEHRESQLLQRLSMGDFFGELALLTDLPRSASAVTYEPSELLVLFQADLYDLIESKPEMGVRLIRSLARIIGERLVQLNDEFVRVDQQGSTA